MDEKLAREYLRRIGVARPHAADAQALRLLHRAHQPAVLFENLSIHLAEPISLAEDDLIDKIVTRRRGGFCYELNGAFALLLQALGFEVRRVAARVYGDGGSDRRDHLALVVRAAGGSGPWLADVGFGSHSSYPLLLDSRQQQEDQAGRILIAPTPAGDLDVLKDAEPQYRVEPRERILTTRSHLLVAADLAAVPLHEERHLLAADRGRPDLDQRPDADLDQRRDPHRGTAGRRRRGAGRLPRSFRDRARPDT